MFAFVLRRVATLPLIFLATVFFVFILTYTIPADPARVAVGPMASDDAVERMREEMGLDDHFILQFGNYLWGIVRLDFGTSTYDGKPVLDSVLSFAPATIELALVATVIAVLTGLVMGVYSAAASGSFADKLLRVIGISGRAVPVFWLALLLQIVLYGWLGWFPSGGRMELGGPEPPTRVTGMYVFDSVITLNFEAFASSAFHLVLPAVSLAVGGIAQVQRMTRAQVLLEMRSDYATVARAKGLKNRHVLLRHVVRNAINPVVTIIGIRFGYLMAGTVLVESIFRWPGLGRYALLAIANLDLPALMGVTLFVTFIFVIVNLVVDILYGFLDPRVKYS